jgi:hypothetical protein
MRRDQRHRLERPAAVRDTHDGIRIEPVTRGPVAPRALDALGRVHEHAVEIEEDGGAA